MGNKFLVSILLFAFICSNSLFSQLVNCKKLVSWTDVVHQEYSSEQLRNIRSNRALFQKIVFNLYSDEYFIPHFKKSYDKMSNSKRSFYWKQLRACKSKKSYPSDFWKIPALLDPFASGYSTYQRLDNKGVFSTTEMEKKVQQIRELKKEIKQLNVTLTNNPINFDELMKLEDRLNTDFNILFPSAIKQLKINIQNAKSSSAFTTLKSKIYSFPDKPNNLTEISALADFELNNSELFKELTKSGFTEITNALNTKRRPILLNHLKSELSSFKNSSFKNDVDYYVSFENRFSRYVNVLEANDKSDILNMIESKLEMIVKNEVNLDMDGLNSFESDDFTALRDLIKFEKQISRKYSAVSRKELVRNWLNLVKSKVDLKIAWLQLNGNPKQVELIGRGFLKGENGFETNIDLGIEFLEVAHKKGSTSAAGLLGTVYYGLLEGFKKYKDINKSLKWFLNGFERKENKTIASLIADIYSEKGNKAEARKWFGISAKMGHISSQNLYGKYLIMGWGGDKDIDQGISWMKKAANAESKSSSRAQLELALALLSGEFGVPKNTSLGQKYLIKSANAGNTEAEVMLGMSMLLGKYGFSIDKVEARKFINRAAVKGDKDAVNYIRNYF